MDWIFLEYWCMIMVVILFFVVRIICFLSGGSYGVIGWVLKICCGDCNFFCGFLSSEGGLFISSIGDYFECWFWFYFGLLCF